MELKPGDRVRRVRTSADPYRIYDVLYVDRWAVVLRVETTTIVRSHWEMERDWEVVPLDVITFITIYADGGGGSCYSTLSHAMAGSLMPLREIHEYNITQRTTVKVHPGRLP